MHNSVSMPKGGKGYIKTFPYLTLPFRYTALSVPTYLGKVGRPWPIPSLVMTTYDWVIYHPVMRRCAADDRPDHLPGKDTSAGWRCGIVLYNTTRAAICRADHSPFISTTLHSTYTNKSRSIYGYSRHQHNNASHPQPPSPGRDVVSWQETARCAQAYFALGPASRPGSRDKEQARHDTIGDHLHIGVQTNDGTIPSRCSGLSRLGCSCICAARARAKGSSAFLSLISQHR